jgi:hypothetical protein
MTRRKSPAKTSAPQVEAGARRMTLRGWQAIASFLGQSVSVAQRWARNGMPIIREGRSVTAAAGELTSWLGRESGGEPVHVADPQADLTRELERGLSFVRREKKH